MAPSRKTGSASRKALLVASTGGHLAQLVRLAPTLDVSDDSLWLTFRTPQSESLLQGRRVSYIPYIRPRDWRGVLKASRTIAQLLRRESFDAAVSTGAAPAVAALPLARLQGIDTTYIESVSRVDGPSLTGRILAATRSARLYTQHPSWAGARWQARPSVFHTVTPVSRPRVERPSLFVTLGTIEGYAFDALIDAVRSTGLADERTVWQLGCTTPGGALPGRYFSQVSASDFDRYATEADVVISHAGVGSLLRLLDLGVSPILAIRRKSRDEHVDDHQAQIAHLASDHGIATAVEVDELTDQTILHATGRAIASSPTPPIG